MKKANPKSIWLLITVLLPLILVVFSLNISTTNKINNLENSINSFSNNNLSKLNAASVSQQFPTFKNYKINQISTTNITDLDIYDFVPSSSRCPEILIGSEESQFYMLLGQDPAFTSTWQPELIFNPSTHPLAQTKVIYGMQIGINSGNSTDILVIDSVGEYHLYRHNDASRNYYDNVVFWSEQNPDYTNATSYIEGNDVTCSDRIEIGGRFNRNDELVLGTDNGSVVLVSTDWVFGSGTSFYEYSISGGFSSNYVMDLGVSDMNRDGDLDVVAAFSNDKIVVFENDKSPIYGTWNAQPISASNYATQSLCLGDLNLDGKDDIIVGLQDGTINIWENDGTPHSGYLSSPNTIANLNSLIRDIKVTDLDLDGDLDIVCSLDNGNITFLENPLHMPLLGEDQINDPVPSPQIDPFISSNWNYTYISNLDVSSANVFKMADMDYDGDTDLVVGYSSGYVYLVENEYNDPALVTDTSLGTNFGNAELIQNNDDAGLYNKYSFLDFGDVDNDGDLDIIASTTVPTNPATYGTLVLYKNPGYDILNDFEAVHSWESYVIYSFLDRNFYDIKLHDLDKDGYLDVLVIEDTTTIRALQNDGTPWNSPWTGWNSNPISIVFSSPNNNLLSGKILYLDDYNFDHQLDILWCTSTAGSSSEDINLVRLNKETPWSTTTDVTPIISNPTANTYSTKLITGTFNNDFLIDFAYVDNLGHIYQAYGTNLLTSFKPSNSIWDYWNDNFTTTISNIDWNNDQIDDIAFATGGLSNNIRAFKTDWISANNFFLRSNSFNSIIKGMETEDMDNDGVEDYVIWDDFKVSVMKGNKDSNIIRFGEIKEIDEYDEFINNVLIEDFDNDGDLDLIISTIKNIYYYPNLLNQDNEAPDIQIKLNKYRVADNVKIDAISDKPLLFNPIIKIFNETNDLLKTDVMTPNGTLFPNGLDKCWTYNYEVNQTSNHTIIITAKNYYGIEGEYEAEFVADLTLPEFTIKINGPLIENYSNRSIYVKITNKSDIVGNNQIELNISRFGVIIQQNIYVQYNSTEEAFIKTFEFNFEGNYKLGLIASDDLLANFVYIEKDFVIDKTAPMIDTMYYPPNSNYKYSSNRNLNFSALFSEKIVKIEFFAKKGDNIISNATIHNLDLEEDGNMTISVLFDFILGTKGVLDLIVEFYDRAGNNNSVARRIEIIVLTPENCGFWIINSNKNIINTTSNNLIYLNWHDFENKYAQEVQISVAKLGSDLEFDDPVDIFYSQSVQYPVELPEESGIYNITLRFQNLDDFVDVSKLIELTLPDYTIYIFYTVVGIIAFASIVFTIFKIKNRKPKEKSWKEFMKEDSGSI